MISCFVFDVDDAFLFCHPHTMRNGDDAVRMQRHMGGNAIVAITTAAAALHYIIYTSKSAWAWATPLAPATATESGLYTICVFGLMMAMAYVSDEARPPLSAIALPDGANTTMFITAAFIRLLSLSLLAVVRAGSSSMIGNLSTTMGIVSVILAAAFNDDDTARPEVTFDNDAV